MTEFMGNVSSQVVNIESTLEQEDGTWYLHNTIEDDNGNEIDDWITDDPDAIDEWFADQAMNAALWREYRGIESPHGHIVPLGPGNSNAGTR